jgi:hypothetical protein
MCNKTVLVPIPDWCVDGKHYFDFDVKHPEYGINRKNKKCFRIDACIVPLLKMLWDRGIKTTGSCCGHDKKPAMIGFEWRGQEYSITKIEN